MKAKLRLILVGGALAASALSAAPADAADRLIARGASSVDAYGGNVVWEVGRGGDDDAEPSSDYFVRDARGTRRLPLDPYLGQLDLGARRGGGTQAVFTRCRGGQPCVLGTYDFRSRATGNLSSLSRLRGSEHSASVWNGRFAFARTHGQQVGTSDSVGSLFATSPLRTVARVPPVETDLRGQRLAYVTSHAEGNRTLYVATLPRRDGRVRSCFVARTTDTQSDSTALILSNPVLTATHVYWMRKDESGPSVSGRRASVRRRRLPGRDCRLSGREERSREIGGMSSFAVDRGRFFFIAPSANELGGADYGLKEATDPPFTFTR